MTGLLRCHTCTFVQAEVNKDDQQILRCGVSGQIRNARSGCNLTLERANEAQQQASRIMGERLGAMQPYFDEAAYAAAETARAEHQATRRAQVEAIEAERASWADTGADLTDDSQLEED